MNTQTKVAVKAIKDYTGAETVISMHTHNWKRIAGYCAAAALTTCFLFVGITILKPVKTYDSSLMNCERRESLESGVKVIYVNCYQEK